MALHWAAVRSWNRLPPEQPEVPWVPCTRFSFLEMKHRRAPQKNEMMWVNCSIGSFVAVAVAGWFHYKELTKDKEKEMISVELYIAINFVIGIILFLILVVASLKLPLFRCKSVRLSHILRFFCTAAEMLVVAIIVIGLRKVVETFCWLFVCLALLDICCMRILVPTYDFMGPALFAEVAVNVCLDSDIREVGFSIGVIVISLVVLAVKDVIDTGLWRHVLGRDEPIAAEVDIEMGFNTGHDDQQLTERPHARARRVTLG